MTTLPSAATARSADCRTRFIFDNMAVRGQHVRLEGVWRHIAGQKRYPTAIRRALGELLAAGALLSSNLKTEGTLIMQVQGQGRLKMLVVEATSAGTCRATARWDTQSAINNDENLHSLLGGNGIFAITLQPQEGEPWQGVVPLEGEGIAQMLMNYMKRSEQLDTYITLAASDEACGGLLVQRLPESAPDPESWEHVGTLVQTVSAKELVQLDAHSLLYRLFHQTPPRVFDAEPIEFACTCSRGKVSDMLLMLGGEEVGSVLEEQGSVEIDCDFCSARYVFDETDISALFGTDPAAAVCSGGARVQ
ncbi:MULTISPECIES: Hsp33 family molecular chaperone HslO [unclassified Neisseria]|uniref:Hsp33 family molecular chaperone HslO n=1 Tax=unclassified Neisseria TaxID=2623750 RepID=UPI001072DBD3|nr:MULTISPECIES: Hsp33 family molecular chaperone HslO [unclassified Neisseria]MBF0803636.1 Hsp33 family molecular chaperone HslO [Neisseria sp. 19428wB4_WF04]TFU43632.1 Hsp33 family molecular chaperone HslO [Neisseria sp. WF04]